MLREKASEDRVITFFPRPLFPDATPYTEYDFDAQVLEACRSDKSVKISLKISKVIIVGDISVGKTCLVNRFCHEVFDANYKATIGVDFEVERFDVLQTPYNLQIWDTAGQERFKCIAASYYRGAHVVIVVFDLSNMSTLQSTQKWLEDTLENNTEVPLIFLVGTKKDLMSEAAYSSVEGLAINVSRTMKAEFWAVSSKTGDSVNDLFFRITGLAFNKCILRELEHDDTEKTIISKDFVKLQKDRTDIYDIKKSKCAYKCVKR